MNSLIKLPFRPLSRSSSFLTMAAAGALLLVSPARAELYTTTVSGLGVATYNTVTGVALNPTFISAANSKYAVVAGEDVFVTSGNTIGRYNSTTGATVTAPLIVGLNSPIGLAVSGTDLYVANYVGNSIGKYTTSGATLNASLVTGLSGPFHLAVSGTDLYVSNYGAGTIGKYTTSGGVVNASFIPGLSSPAGLVVWNGRLYVANSGTNEIKVFDAATGVLINASFAAGVTNPFPIAITDGKLYVGNSTGVISVHDATTGATLKASLVSGVTNIYSISIKPVPAPTATIKGKKKVVSTKATYTITGTSIHAVSVMVKIGKAPAKAVKTPAKWSFKAKLKTGANKVVVQAFNSEGVASAPVKITITRTP